MLLKNLINQFSCLPFWDRLPLWFLLFGLLIAPLLGVGQNISGTINDYAEVTAISGSTVTVASATGFSAGDRILMVQMKGATVSTTGTATGNWGDVSAYGSAGCYEFLDISSIAASVITLVSPPCKTYDVNAAVQIVRVPQYGSPTVNAQLTCSDWNGTTGGVLVLEATGTVTMNADIDVSGKGFRGGAICNAFFSCNSATAGVNFVNSGSCAGAEKGEAIDDPPNASRGGVGHYANGGGGSGRGNPGGGGGGNGGDGGLGGSEWSGCNSTIKGIGGEALTYSSSVVFLGGGGGGGYADNGQVVTAGEDGGGIVILMADEIDGNGNEIRANGNSVAIIGNDEGSGGGGAGGTVYLDVNTYSSTLDVEAVGGDGGSNNNNIFQTNCHGPGGGGGGGVLWLSSGSMPANVSFNANGGAAGTVNNPLSICFGTSHGGTDGNDGDTLFNLSLSNFANSLPEVTPPFDTICEGDTVQLLASGAVTYSWLPANSIANLSVAGDTAWVNPDTTTTYTVSAFTCSDTADTTVTITVLQPPSVTLTVPPGFGNNTNDYCEDDPGIYIMTALPLGGTFDGPGVSNDTFSPLVAGPGIFDITYTDTSGICPGVDSQTVEIHPLPVVDLGGLGAGYCVDEPPVAAILTPIGGTLTGTGTINGTFDPSIAGAGSHLITYTFTTNFGCFNQDTQTVDVYPLPNVSFDGLDNLYCIDAGVAALVGDPAGGVFSGSGIAGANFSPANAGVGTHSVTYAFTDGFGCQQSETQTVVVAPLPAVSFPGFSSAYCENDLPIVLSADPAGGVFEGPGVGGAFFDPNAAGVGNHIINYTYTDANGCTSSTSEPVTVHPRPFASFAGLKESYCMDDAVSILEGDPSGGVFEGPGIMGGTFDPGTASPGTHQIIYTYTDENDCSIEVNQDVRVHQLPNVVFRGLDSVYCIDASPVQLRSIPLGGTYIGSGVTNSLFFPRDAGEGSHILNYVYQNEHGCINNAEDTVRIQELPIVKIADIADVYCHDTVVLLTATPTGGIFSGVGISGNDFDPYLAGSGIHQVVYEYFDEVGCYGSDTSSISGVCSSLFIPKAFTPNEDGLNDVFLIRGENITAFDLTIFNRWGEVIFQSLDPSKGWDGFYQNRLSQDGTYPWKLNYQIGNEIPQSITGSVFLLVKSR